MVIYANEQQHFEVTDSLKEGMEACIESVLVLHDIKEEVEISVLFTDDDGIQDINQTMRGINKPTDVLSFPQFEFEEPGKLCVEQEYPYLVLGDIVLNLQRAAQQAEEYGHSFHREVCYLTVHSMLHLLGYDHMEEQEKAVMRKKEEDVLNALGITRYSIQKKGKTL